MSARDLLQRLQNQPLGTALDWKALREEIHDEFERATSGEDRAILLAIFQTVMDLAKRNGDIAPENLHLFRDARQGDYNLLIVRECLVGENVSVELLDEVTKREVAAGRMASDHPLRTQAKVGMLAPHQSHAELVAIAYGALGPPTVAADAKLDAPLTGWRGFLKRFGLYQLR